MMSSKIVVEAVLPSVDTTRQGIETTVRLIAGPGLEIP
jgi:hypothetical protein